MQELGWSISTRSEAMAFSGAIGNARDHRDLMLRYALENKVWEVCGIDVVTWYKIFVDGLKLRGSLRLDWYTCLALAIQETGRKDVNLNKLMNYSGTEKKQNPRETGFQRKDR